MSYKPACSTCSLLHLAFLTDASEVRPRITGCFLYTEVVPLRVYLSILIASHIEGHLGSQYLVTKTMQL